MILTHSIILVLIILIIKKAPARWLSHSSNSPNVNFRDANSRVRFPSSHPLFTDCPHRVFFFFPPNLKFPNLKWFMHCLGLCSFSVPFVACAPTRQRSVLRNSRCLTVKVAVWCLLGRLLPLFHHGSPCWGGFKQLLHLCIFQGNSAWQSITTNRPSEGFDSC